MSGPIWSDTYARTYYYKLVFECVCISSDLCLLMCGDRVDKEGSII